MNKRENIWNAPVEREIDLIDLLWEIVFAWRKIIIISLLLAILAGGLSYIRNISSVAVTAEDGAELTEEEMEAVSKAWNIRRQLTEKQEYQKNSILMNLNGYQKNCVTLQYYINEGQAEDTTILMESFRNYVTTGAIAEDIKENHADIPSEYLSELITYPTYGVDTNGNVTFDQRQFAGIDNIRNSLIILNVIGGSVEEADRLADAVEESVESFKEESLKGGMSADMELLHRYESTIVDENLVERQKLLRDSIKALRTELDATTSEFSDLQQQVFAGESILVEDRDEGTAISQSIKTGSFSKRAIVLGFAIGVVLVCVWEGLKYILNGRVKTEEELQRMYSIRIISTIRPEAESSSRVFGRIDAWLNKLRFKYKGTAEAQLQMTRANILLLCKKENINNICLTSDSMEEVVMKEGEMISEWLKKEGISATYEPNVIYSAAALEHMAEAGNAVIMAKSGYTRYKEFEQELMLCANQAIQMLGVIFIS